VPPAVLADVVDGDDVVVSGAVADDENRVVEDVLSDEVAGSR
jgi:hypothetical protein